MPASTVGKILRRHGRSRRERPPVKVYPRYEREVAGVLIHIDVKRLGRFFTPGRRILGGRNPKAPKGWLAMPALWRSTITRQWPTPRCSPARVKTPPAPSLSVRSSGSRKCLGRRRVRGIARRPRPLSGWRVRLLDQELLPNPAHPEPVDRSRVTHHSRDAGIQAAAGAEAKRAGLAPVGGPCQTAGSEGCWRLRLPLRVRQCRQAIGPGTLSPRHRDDHDA